MGRGLDSNLSKRRATTTARGLHASRVGNPACSCPTHVACAPQGKAWLAAPPAESDGTLSWQCPREAKASVPVASVWKLRSLLV